MRRLRRRPTSAQPAARNAGFTLLEVLLTAILSATLLAGLWSLFGTYLRLFESGQARVERAQLLRALTRQISDDLHAVEELKRSRDDEQGRTEIDDLRVFREELDEGPARDEEQDGGE